MSNNISEQINFIYLKTNEVLKIKHDKIKFMQHIYDNIQTSDKTILLIKNNNKTINYSLKYPNSKKLNILNGVRNNKNY